MTGVKVAHPQAVRMQVALQRRINERKDRQEEHQQHQPIDDPQRQGAAIALDL